MYLILGAPAHAQSITRLTACEALNDLASWNGRLVAVHGAVTHGHVDFSVGGGKDCSRRVDAKGRVWPNNIALESNRNPKPEVVQESWVDPASVAALNKLIGTLYQVYGETPPYEISATFIGTLHAKKLELLGSGFGAQGIFPAELVYYSILDINIKQVEGRAEIEPLE